MNLVQLDDELGPPQILNPLFGTHVHMKVNEGSQIAPTSNSRRREVGDLAIWSLSSAKAGNGVEQLRDNQTSTFWQSDGQQPHLVNIQFLKRMRLIELAIFLDFKTDESYTPQKISIRAHNSFNELQEMKQVEFDDPSGWYVIPLHDKGRDFVKTDLIQIGIIQNQHSGRDTHMRQLKIFAPRESATTSDMQPVFKTVEFTQFQYIR